ncbi:MAG TPA: hypothetical protein VKX28_15745 [Xanthobacteraceae bacterium]|nr:hypothetical protein [Xanthobacteraceae bacterium]
MDNAVLTTAWLDAVYRARSAAYQHYVQEVPQAKPAPANRTLIDAIESGLQADGLEPQQPLDPVQAAAQTQATTDQTSGRQVDRLA